jgi:hypothetical protein
MKMKIETMNFSESNTQTWTSKWMDIKKFEIAKRYKKHPLAMQKRTRQLQPPGPPLSLDRVRVIRAGPRTRPAVGIVANHDLNNTAIRAANHQKRATDNDKDGPAHHGDPARGLLELALVPVVVQPHAAHGLEAHEGAEEGADERDEAAEDGDR